MMTKPELKTLGASSALAAEFSKNAIIKIAQEMETEETKQINDIRKKEVRMLFCEVFPEYNTAKAIPVPDLTASLKKDALVER
jgi:hypothetical protein